MAQSCVAAPGHCRYSSAMSPSLRQQLNMSILETERTFQRLRAQSNVNPRLIEGVQHELQILQHKLESLPQDEPNIAYA